MYSSIELEERRKVIKNCYWPIFDLADNGISIGLEAPAVTIEIIRDIDKQWTNELVNYIKAGKIEFIGSGFSQIIGPLVPAKVNEWNQKLGSEVYSEILGVKPRIALINEMSYSSGIIEHYIDAGYESIIMEWNNPRSSHMEWVNEWRFNPQKALGCNNKTIPIIWADSIAFQKFQRFVHGEYGLREYIQYIKSQLGENIRYFPLYSNDVEIFDYRPGRYHTETQIHGSSEWDRIIELYTQLDQEDWCTLIFPSKALVGADDPNTNNELRLESAAQPIPVKKQGKYNINRWAVTGRNDLGINTKCYQIYEGLISNNNENSSDWRELCYLWSSDFRTHITEGRWQDYVVQLDNSLNEYLPQTEHEKKEILLKGESPQVSEDDKSFKIENDNYIVILNKRKGLTIQELVCKSISDESLLGTLDHGFYDDISLGADYYSGHAVIEKPGEHKVTDLGKLAPEIVEASNSIRLKTEQKWANYRFKNNILINSEEIILEKAIEAETIEKAIIHPYNFTINPRAWDRETLFIETHNGGSSPERFFLKGQKISHGDLYSPLISARQGYGNTEGLFIIGDSEKSIAFFCGMTLSALIPSIVYFEDNNDYFFRLQYSAQELDETLKNRSMTGILMKMKIQACPK